MTPVQPPKLHLAQSSGHISFHKCLFSYQLKKFRVTENGHG